MESKEFAKKICGLFSDRKAEDIVTINLSGKTEVADYYVIASGRSMTHTRSLTDHVEEEMDKINNSRAVLEDLNLVIEEIDSFKDEKQRMDELFKELSKDSKSKLVVYDQYDNLNVLPFLRISINRINYNKSKIISVHASS